ncbi:MAG: serine/threonine protein kinase [Drouetiella hepatica Uher 2000/2452]|jgi:WD40 repeat protein|uniref:Serine/threonine protein kinase n=1 Tax=Drouetiella hepatica Uher 2000/2452 TaxID=904376 RepID=A0A951QCJ0_9CYAN|nr:serine/threonine protein kinase [Drouetiella hepatica Uher 2000/2452]
MSYCLNPVCQKPRNAEDAKFCQNCGAKLWVGDRYQALEVIGQGGFGRTFLAIDKQGQKSDRCVIKQILPRSLGLNSPGAPRIGDLFQREVAQLTELGQHPQIPRLLDHLAWEDGFYLIQQYIEGQNLEQVLEKEDTWSEAQIWELLADLLPVLQFVHSRQVIHRDIKPENIVRPRSGSKLVLVDFGASKYAEKTTARTGTLIGSAGYVAPEQAMGKAVFASDLYSLGVTCVHLLTGIHPFDLYSVSEDAWVWRQYLTQPVTSRLRKVLDKLLQRGLSQRYQSAAEVLQNLPAARSQPTKSSHPSGLWICDRTLTGHEGEVTALSISPSGRTLASGSRDKTVKLWRLDSGELLHTFGGRSWSNLWSNISGSTLGHQDRISALAFSRNGRILASGSSDGSVKLWDLAKLTLISTLPGHGWEISAVTFDPQSFLLASGSGDGLIQLWEPETNELLANLAQHQERVSALAIHPQGQLISGSYDKTIRLWNLSNGQVIRTLRGHVDRVSALTLTPDGSVLITASWDRTIKLWDSQWEQLRVISAHRDRINCLAMHPTGKLFASGSEDNSIKLWDIASGSRLALLRHSWGVNAIAFSPDGQRLVSGSADETIKIWRRTEEICTEKIF